MRARPAAGTRALLATVLIFFTAGCSLLGGSSPPEDVDLEFEGFAAVERSEAIERIAYLFEEFASESSHGPVLDDAAFELELLLESRGFREARVESALVTDEGTRPIARFVANLGVRTRITTLELDGVDAAQREAARAILRTGVQDSWYSERAVSAGVRALVAWLRERGYARAEAAEPRVVFSADGSEAVVTVAVVPGPLHELAQVDIRFASGARPEGIPAPTLDSLVKEFLGKPWTERVSRHLRGRIGAVLGEHGYPDAKVAGQQSDQDPSAVVLVFDVDPGPRVRIGVVRIQGGDATRASFLESRVELETDAWYQRSLLLATIQNLSRSGLFDSIDVAVVAADPPHVVDGAETRDVVVDVVEAPAREFHVEPGYGSYEGLRLGFGARQKNLFGTGRIADLTATVGELAQRAELSLIDPWILGSSATATASVFWNRRQEPSFERLERGVELGASWRLGEEWSVRANWQYRQSEARDVEVDAPAVDDDVGISEISFQPTWDSRDAFDDPHRGQLTRGGADISADVLGSEVEFVRLRLEHARFVPLAARTTLALSARIGWIMPIGGTDEIPIQERFFNGGENSVRSFRESELGPEDSNGSPIGGEASTTATVEVRQGLGRRFQVAVFVDAGTVELESDDLFAFTDPGLGIGVGLRYLLPIGPIRLDGAVNPDPDEGESDAVMHLSVGFSF